MVAGFSTMLLFTEPWVWQGKMPYLAYPRPGRGYSVGTAVPKVVGVDRKNLNINTDLTTVTRDKAIRL